MQDIIYKLFLSSKGLIFIYVLRLSKLNHIVNNIHALLFIELNTSGKWKIEVLKSNNHTLIVIVLL